jgi:hypothetical protein
MSSALRALVTQLLQRGDIARIGTNPAAQFGLPARRYLGAELLPERPVNENSYTEDRIRYRTVIANAGTRYSPTQKKGGRLVGSMLVTLGESDIASEFTSEDYDGLLRYLARNATMEAVTAITNWLDAQVNLPLIEWIERARWQAMIDCQVLLRGDNGYAQDVLYSNPAGHRAAAAGAWSNDAVDPFDDIYAQANLLASKGHPVRRIIGSQNVQTILGGNEKVRTRAGRVTVSSAGQIQAVGSRATPAQINAALADDELPAMEKYDLQYTTSTGTGRFIPNNVVVLIGATGEQSDAIDFGDTVLQISDVLGYAAVGRAAGQSGPGRVIRAEPFDNKPPRVEGEGWQTALPVVTNPEAIAVITGIA